MRAALRRLASLRLPALLAAPLLVSATPPVPPVNWALITDEAALPRTLSSFGLFIDGNPRVPHPRLIPYTLRTPLFTDYADKTRFILLPPGATVRANGGEMPDFPVGTALVKSFSYADHHGGQPIETRLLLRRASGWVALPYVWNADGSDAMLRLGGTRVPVTFRSPDGQTRRISYAVPNRNQCKDCHALDGAIVPLGPKAHNLVPGKGAGNGADQMARIMADVPRMAIWDRADTGTIDQRARAYLDVNCGHCHNPRGSASNSGLFLDLANRDPVALGIGKRPVAAGRGSGGLDFAIAPGQPDASIMVHRMASLDPGVAMPELGRNMVHSEAVALMREWIAQMPTKRQGR